MANIERKKLMEGKNYRWTKKNIMNDKERKKEILDGQRVKWRKQK